MRKRIAFVLFLFCTVGPAFAQEPKSVTPLSKPKSELRNPQLTWAVVVGISDYLDPSITDLRFANRDAEIFSEYLKSASGGQVNPQQVQLLTNQQASMAGIQSALEWLLKNMKQGGQAVLFFSGHGDVETKNEQEKGYLLAYDTPKNNYRLNAVDLDYLNEHIIGGLSRLGAKVIVIMDACHSGTLAGENIGGREATASELMKRFASEVKVMSCQPYELSLEGSRWGGGRGVFSYYLIDGLKGRADEDGDHRVDLYELERFLQNRIRTASNKTQHPDIFGGRKEESLFGVDEAAVAEMKSIEKVEIQQDFEKEILSKLASREGYANYLHFTEALNMGNLLGSDGHDALTYYDALYADTVFIPLRGIMDERLTTAFIDSVQQALMAYLGTDPQELEQRDRFDQKYARFSKYLAKAAEILGVKDSRYRQTKAKQYYFEGLVLRMEGERRGGSDSLYRLALEKQQKALEQENRAAYIYNELGFLLIQLGQRDEGMAQLQKAVSLSPTWAIPYNNLAIGCKLADSLEAAKAYYWKAIDLKPDFASAYANLGNLLDELEQPDSAVLLYQKAIELNPGDKDNYFNLGVLLSQQEGREREAGEAYRQALQIDPGYAEAWLELGNLYDALQRPDSAELMYRTAIESKPDYATAYRALGIHYYEAGRLGEAETRFQKAVELQPDYTEAYLSLGTLYTQTNRPEAAERMLSEAIRCDSTSITAYQGLVVLYQNQWKKALVLVQNAPIDTAEKMQVWWQSGLVLSESGAFDKAAKAFHQANELNPAEPLGYFMLCSFHASRGQDRDALDYLEKTLEAARRSGEDYFETLQTESSLEALRKSKRYQELLTRYFPGRK